MLKNISNLEGAQKLTKNEQKTINGARPVDPKSCVGKSMGELCTSYGWVCCFGVCTDPFSPASCITNP